MKRISVLMATLFLCASAFGQVPGVGLSAGLGGGLATGQGDFSDFSGYNLGLKAKLSLPAVPLRPVVVAGYNEFSRSGIALKNRILTFGAGAEYSPISFGVVSPYLALDAAMNLLTTNARDAHGATRFGGGIGLGAELNPPAFPVSFDLEAKYRFNNLVGKMETERGRNHLQVGVNVGVKLF
ncbi:MAG: outer membrane beta-barrel protein [Chloroherpetonaceae bacterium]|nr:outer membrane beta-barrel protein [Chloroherpetonaceae bacterium]MDW8438436.1 outer membrane beta-barrel protein [Chloroherpetonaceae bacterium]